MAHGAEQLRISFIAGGLGTGGAEKQFIYMLRSLLHVGAAVQVLALTEGEVHDHSLAELGIQPVRIRRGANPVARLVQIRREVRAFRPHFLQSTHFFTNFYAGMAGLLAGVTSIGAVRSDLHHDLAGVGRLGPWILRLPSVLLANSHNARDNAVRLGLTAQRIHVLHNVIDLEAFDHRQALPPTGEPVPGGASAVRAITVARLVPVKRLERFLQVLALARREAPEIQGLVVGSGPQEERLRATAESLGLLPGPGSSSSGVHFLGERSDVPALLARSDLFVLTSDREGFPNVLLEAMAASLPILSTPAGEAREIVVPHENGYLLPFDDVPALAGRMVELARSPGLRQSLGRAGRRIVENQFSFPRLERRLIEFYRSVASQRNDRAALSVLDQALNERGVIGLS